MSILKRWARSKAENPVRLSDTLEVIKVIHPESRTPKWYGAVINQLIKSQGDLPLESVTQKHIQSWWAEVQARDLSRWTLNSYARAVRALFNHLVRLEHLESSPAENLKVPKPPPAKPKDITDDELQALLDVARAAVRDYALVLMLRDTGARVGGLVSMSTDYLELYPEGGRVMVTEKGDKSRWVFFGREAAKAMGVYLDYRAPEAPRTLWLDQRGGSPLATGGVYHLLRRLAKKAGVTRFNPHSFRHRLVKQMVGNGAPNKIIQDLMGWSSSEMVQVYAVHTADELEKHHQQYTNR